jgi:hypothetical protein
MESPDKTTTDELLIAVLARVTAIEAILRTFAAIWLRTVVPDADRKTFVEHPLVKAFGAMSGESIESLVESLSEQFPDFEKVIREHVELSMRDLIQKLAGNKTDG